MHDDLKLIKEKYGESMMHLCRRLFPTILEENGLLFRLLSNHFAYSKCLCSDIIKSDKIEKFKEYINSFIDGNTCMVVTNKSTKELLAEAGYDLYECKSEEDIQKFRKYYKSDEELCTFNGGRVKSHYVFFAVKKNVDMFKREDFLFPKREDSYGTSVISIQFSKGNINDLSIKNRYNHKVSNPDATFSNNLDNIIPGLTMAFTRDYGFNIKCHNDILMLPEYIYYKDKYYKYNYERENVFYCPNNIVIDTNYGEVTHYKKERYLVFDSFILDLQNKKFLPSIFSDEKNFIQTFPDIYRIDILSNKETKGKYIKINDSILIELDYNNRMIFYYNSAITSIDDIFLYHNKYLQEICLPNVREIGNSFMFNNNVLEKIFCNNVEVIKDNFLRNNNSVQMIYMPKIKKIGKYFLPFDKKINGILNIPSLEEVGDAFLSSADVKKVYMKSLKIAGRAFLQDSSLEELFLPIIEKLGFNSLRSSSYINDIVKSKLRNSNSYITDYKNEELQFLLDDGKKLTKRK